MQMRLRARRLHSPSVAILVSAREYPISSKIVNIDVSPRERERERERFTHPKIVEGGIGDALPRDVFGKLLERRGILRHRDYRPRHELPVLSHRQVPRLYPHEVVESELQY